MDEWVSGDRFNLSPTENGTLHEKEPNIPVDHKVTRSYKRKQDEMNHVPQSYNDMDPATAAFEREWDKRTNMKYISKIVFDGYEITTWYFSPFPDKYGRMPMLYICRSCLKYMCTVGTYQYHLSNCDRRKPPGKEIYRKDTLSVFEVDGDVHKVYCQNLCLMSKLFLDHKAVFFDVESFYFYVLTETDNKGVHFVGYFSKEKESFDYKSNNNLATILTLPPYQKRGYGRFLIAFSYALSKIEGEVGTPEKPLSDLGSRSYMSYWTYELLNVLSRRPKSSIKDLSSQTKIMESDVIKALESLKLVTHWKGDHIVSVTPKRIKSLLNSDAYRVPKLTVDPECINWSPPPKPPPAEKSKEQ